MWLKLFCHESSRSGGHDGGGNCSSHMKTVPVVGFCDIPIIHLTLSLWLIFSLVLEIYIFHPSKVDWIHILCHHQRSISFHLYYQRTTFLIGYTEHDRITSCSLLTHSLSISMHKTEWREAEDSWSDSVLHHEDSWSGSVLHHAEGVDAPVVPLGELAEVVIPALVARPQRLPHAVLLPLPQCEYFVMSRN